MASITLTPELLRDTVQCSLARAREWTGPLNETLYLFAIDPPRRAAAFLAQISHESGRLVYTSELWGPTPAQRGYEGRADLGNTQPGDGSRFRGHGLIQTTGRANHKATRDGLRAPRWGLADVPDFEADPKALTTPRWAALSAGWYWHARGLSVLADAGRFDDITRRINGGMNGAEDRRTLHKLAQRALGI